MDSGNILRYAVGIATGLAVVFGNCEAARLNHERHYQELVCPAPYSMEHRIEGGRIDCLTDSHAIEVDFADKWAEGIGQALYYSAITGKHAGLVLIAESDGDCRHVEKALAAVEQHRLWLTVWVVGPSAKCGLPLMNHPTMEGGSNAQDAPDPDRGRRPVSAPPSLTCAPTIRPTSPAATPARSAPWPRTATVPRPPSRPSAPGTTAIRSASACVATACRRAPWASSPATADSAVTPDLQLPGWARRGEYGLRKP